MSDHEMRKFDGKKINEQLQKTVVLEVTSQKVKKAKNPTRHPEASQNAFVSLKLPKILILVKYSFPKK